MRLAHIFVYSWPFSLPKSDKWAKYFSAYFSDNVIDSTTDKDNWLISPCKSKYTNKHTVEFELTPFSLITCNIKVRFWTGHHFADKAFDIHERVTESTKTWIGTDLKECQVSAEKTREVAIAFE